MPRKHLGPPRLQRWGMEVELKQMASAPPRQTPTSAELEQMTSAHQISESTTTTPATTAIFRCSEVDLRACKISAGLYVRILRGSVADAAYLRKHGHSETWKYRYEVLKYVLTVLVSRFQQMVQFRASSHGN